MQKAIVIGATGLVGRQLVELLLENAHFYKVVVFTRRSLGIQNKILEENIINFDAPATWQHLVTGDVLFSALGTTLKQAGSKEKQYLIDHTYQYHFAKAAAGNGIPAYVLVSSAGANARSNLFYNKMKGELENDIQQLNFVSTTILQPGLLHGKRQDERVGEKIAFKILRFINKLGIAKRYRPIDAKIVAAAMINAAIKAKQGVQVYTLNEVFRLGGE